jgi:Carboxylesterase family
MKTVFALLILTMSAYAADTVKTANGVLEGTVNPAMGIRMFKGIPFAQPPVGDLRCKEPQPPKDWTGVRKADQFGPRCAQHPVFGVRRGVRTLKQLARSYLTISKDLARVMSRLKAVYRSWAIPVYWAHFIFSAAVRRPVCNPGRWG